MYRNPNLDRLRQGEFREVSPRLAHIVDEVAPKLWNEASDGEAVIPDEWKAPIDGLAAQVHQRAEKRGGELSLVERRGYEWSWAMGAVTNSVDYMMRLMRVDLDFAEGKETMASMLLVHRALEQLHLELRNGGSVVDDGGGEENALRVYRALKALSPRFDDTSQRRARALRIVEQSAKDTRILTDEEIEVSVEKMRGHSVEAGTSFNSDDEQRQRKWFRAELPMLKALSARAMLAEIDDKFLSLDPLLILEELSDTASNSKGGRSDGGEARTGPARALASLALRCQALEYKQDNDESFDEAVERVRKNLHTTRSRLRDELRRFPGQVPHEDDGT